MNERAYSPFSDGRIYRDFFYLVALFLMGTLYFTLLVTGFSLGVGLLIILIGIPILRFMLRVSRGLAALDRVLTASLLYPGAAAGDGDLSERVAAEVQTMTEWEGVGYLFGRFVLGLLSVNIAGVLLPFLLVEMVLNEAGLRTGMISAQILRLLAAALSGSGLTHVSILPREKPKNDYGVRPLEAVDEDDPTVRYYLDDEGEIQKAKHG